MIPSSRDGNRYAISFRDEISGYAVVKIMKYKTHALQAFKEYVAIYGRPKILPTDNRTENKNKAYKKFCISKEISPDYKVPETPDQNGFAERFNTTVVESQ